MSASVERFLIVCGGTGGHLAPGIALAQRLRRRGHVCRLVVSRKEIDGRMSGKYAAELDFESAPGVGLRFTPVGLVRFVVHFVWSLLAAGRAMRRFHPSAVVVFGGFLSPPYVLWSRLRGVYLAVHESNRRPGRSVRLIARLARRVYLPVGVRLRGVRPARVRPTGYPLREEIAHVRKAEARERRQLDNHGKVLVVIGGSQGARALNEWVREHEDTLAREGINVISVTGPGKGTDERRVVPTSSGGEVVIERISFCDDMSLLLSNADLVISRAGAGAIAELTACLAPSILIPYPHAADLHQNANAEFLERQGGALSLPESQLPLRLLAETRELLFNDWMLHRMRENLRALDRGDEAMQMATDLERALKQERAQAPEVKREATA